MSFDIDEEIASLNEDLENMEVKDFLTELLKFIKESPYARGKRIEDRFMDGFITLNEDQKYLLNVSLTYEFWKFIHGERNLV